MSTERNNLDNTETIDYVAVDWLGRIRLPAALRRRFGIKRGDKLTVSSSNDGICVRTFDQNMKVALEYFRSLAPADVLLSEELIKERREEARREDEEYRAWRDRSRTGRTAKKPPTTD